MTNKFDLIKVLNSPKKEEILPEGVKYQHYAIVLENIDYNVYIPLREAKKFELMLEVRGKMSRNELRKVLTEFRGILE